MTVGVREHGDKADPNYARYHPDSTRNGAPAPEPAAQAEYTPEQIEAVRDYSDMGYAYVNSYLRKGEGDIGGYDADDHERLVARAKDLDAQMRRALRPLPELDLYRGTDHSAFPEEWNIWRRTPEEMAEALRAHVGETVSDAAFLSTSVGEGTLFYLGGAIRLQLHAPAGTPGINTEGGLAKFQEGNEVILGPGTKWRIDSVNVAGPEAIRGGGTVMVVHGTVVP